MLILKVDPGEAPEIVHIDGTLESMQEIVGGFIEIAPADLPAGLVLICDEEGKLKINTPNIFDTMGTVFICRTDGEEFVSITDKDYEPLMGIIRQEQEKPIITDAELLEYGQRCVDLPIQACAAMFERAPMFYREALKSWYIKETLGGIEP